MRFTSRTLTSYSFAPAWSFDTTTAWATCDRTRAIAANNRRFLLLSQEGVFEFIEKFFFHDSKIKNVKMIKKNVDFRPQTPSKSEPKGG